MNKKWMLLILVFSFLPAGLPLLAQSNELLDAFLEEDQASLGKTAYFTLLAAEMIAEDATESDAVSKLKDQGWGVEADGADRPVTMGELSYIVMRALEIPGGLMYRLAPGPRYASRELVYLGIVQRRNNPSRVPSGREVLRVIGRALEWKEEWS